MDENTSKSWSWVDVVLIAATVIFGFSAISFGHDSMCDGPIAIILVIVLVVRWGIRLTSSNSEVVTPVQHQVTTPQSPPPPPVVYVINPGRPQKWEPQKATAFLQTILQESKTSDIDFSIRATNKTIEFVVLFGHGYITLATLRGIVQMFYPDAEVNAYQPPEKTYPLNRRFLFFKPSTQFPLFESLRSVEDVARGDPLTTITQAMSALEEGEGVEYSIALIGRPTHFSEKEVHEMLTISKAEAGQFTPRFYRAKDFWTQLGEDFVRGWIDARTRISRYQVSDERLYRGKLTQPLYFATISVTLDTPVKERVGLLAAIASPMKNFAFPDRPIIESGLEKEITVHDEHERYFYGTSNIHLNWRASDDPARFDLSQQHAFLVTVNELSALWHMPHEGFAAPKIHWIGLGQNPLPTSLQNVDDGILLGKNRIGSSEKPVYLPQADRTAHTAILGKPGRGKSSLMHRMIHEDIRAGRGLCLIDPKGTLVSRVLQHSIPPEREQDVLILDVSTLVDGVFYPPPMNVFFSDSATPDMAARRLLTIFNTIFDDFADKKMADTLNNALLAIHHVSKPTLLDIRCLFAEPEFRYEVTQRIQNPTVRDFWERWHDPKKSGQFEALAEPVLWRLQSFYNNDRLQTITCHPNRLNLPKLIAENKIILVSLGDRMETMPDKERFVLGATLITQIELAARSGAVTKPPYLLYIDEVQEFVKTSLPKMLSQLREYGLGMVIANQYFAQLFGDTFHALEGTVSTLISFEVGKSDATALAPYMQPNFASNRWC